MSELFERLATITNEPAESSAVLALLADVEAKRGELRAEAKALQAQAIDPLVDSAAAAAASDALGRIQLEEKRCAAAAEMLDARLRNVQAGEQAARNAVAYAEAKQELAALAEDIRKVYPKAAGQIGDLIRRILACNAKIVEANRNKAAGEPLLDFPENIARGAGPANGEALLAYAVRLPAFAIKESFFKPIWPPKEGFR